MLPENAASQPKQNAAEALTGTLQKMIVDDASITMQLDLNGLNGSGSLLARPVTLHFAAAPNSFFPVLVFNDLLRGIQPGSMALALQNSSSAGVNVPGYRNLPAALRSSLKRLTVEKLPSGQGFVPAVRDSNTGFTFFNIEGHRTITMLQLSRLASMGAGFSYQKSLPGHWVFHQRLVSLAGTISIGAAMQPIQIDHIVRGETKSIAMPSMQHAVSPGSPRSTPIFRRREIEFARVFSKCVFQPLRHPLGIHALGRRRALPYKHPQIRGLIDLVVRATNNAQYVNSVTASRHRSSWANTEGKQPICSVCRSYCVP